MITLIKYLIINILVNIEIDVLSKTLKLLHQMFGYVTFGGPF